MNKVYLLPALLFSSACCDPAVSSKGRSDAPRTKEKWHLATGSLDPNCEHSGSNPDGGVQFIASCPTTSTSPDGKWKLVLGKEGPNEGDTAPVTLRSNDGSRNAAVPQLSDSMPFILYWSPRPNWFLVSHHVGSFMDRPEVYEVTEEGVRSHDEFRRQGLKLAKQMNPCLPQKGDDWASGDVIGLSRDGRRLAWVFVTRTDMCSVDWGGTSVSHDKHWKSFLMVSNVETGEVEPGSVVKIDDPENFEIPNDSRYVEFQMPASRPTAKPISPN